MRKIIHAIAYVCLAALAALPGSALADTATFTAAPVSGCPDCTAKDTTGLVVYANGTLLPNGWDVKTSSSGLYIANRIGGYFKLPGKTFDLTGLKLFATNVFSSTTAPVTYTLYAFHPGNPIADQVQVTINSRVVKDVPLTDTRLLNLDSVFVRFGSEIGYSYFIETRFTPH